MRIALDATYSAGEQLSGVGVYSQEILAAMAAAHPEVQFLFCYRPHRLARSLRAKLPPNARRRLLQEPIVPRSDLFHGLNQRLPRARFHRSVTTFHDLFVLTQEYSTPEFRRRFAEQARDAAARSDLIICVSQFTADQVEALLGVPRKRLRVVHHGVHAPLDPPPASAREPIVLHVGAIQKRKNIVRLIEAFERMPAGWRLVLAGSRGFGAEEIVGRIEKSSCRERIEAPGYVNPQALQAYYARASILSFPSLDEGFGIPVIEAMAAGLPVVASARPSIVEAAGDAAVLVDPASADELAAALIKLAADVHLREDLARRGRIRSMAFTWAEAARKTWDVYCELGIA
ncbi:MAG: glycosyltransferase family 4 protein [Bryobacteraceae bacterium]